MMNSIVNRIVLLAAAALFLSGCVVSGVDVEQEQASGLAGELLDGGSFGQSFTLEYDGLYRVDLYTATYARDNSHPVIIRIIPGDCGADLQNREGLVHIELPSERISNSGPTIITFAPIEGVAGQTLCLTMESPGSVPGDSITVYHHAEDVYPGGQFYIDGAPSGGDLAFIAYTQEAFSPADIWHDFYSRASQDAPFFTFYLALLGVLIIALLAALVWPRRANVPSSSGEANGASVAGDEQAGAK